MVNQKSRARRSKRRFFMNRFKDVKCDAWSIVHTNIRGYVCKALSINPILDRADVLTINETFLKNNKKLKIPGFSCFTRNRKISMEEVLQLALNLKMLWMC